jgi:hypothetical protein
MEPEKNNPPKQKYIWILQLFLAVAVAVLLFLQFIL